MTASAHTYRADVDGLRAIAIIAVVAFHAFPSLAPGGFVGVDVFFTISGFLISGIIFAALDNGRFSFLQFYARRIARIFPALIVVLVAALVMGWFVLLPDAYAMLGKHVRGASMFILNFMLNHEAGYFDAAAEAKPLLHLWSLAIEEQFYIVWPLIAVVAVRRGWDLFNIVVVALAASFVYASVLVLRHPEAAFFLPAPRAWELLTGVLLAYVSRYGVTGFGARLPAPPVTVPADVRAVAGLAGIIFPVALLDGASLFPGPWALAPTLGTALLISAGPDAWLNRMLLANRAMVFIGLISYPLYLWHWPLLSLARIASGGDVASSVRLGLVALAAMLAILTYLAAERPIRFGGLPRRRAAVALAAVFLGVGLSGQTVKSGLVAPFSSRFGVGRIVAAKADWNFPDGLEQLDIDGAKVWRKPGTGGTVLFLGDSNAEQYASRISALIEAAPGLYKTALFLTGDGCPPIPNVSEPRHPECNALNHAATGLAARTKTDTVVIAAQWWGYFGSPRYVADGKPLSSPGGADSALASLGAQIRGFVAGGRSVHLVLNIPIGRDFDPQHLVERSFMTFTIRRGGIPRRTLEDRYGGLNRRIAKVATAAGATVIDPLAFICEAKRCPATDAAGDPIYKDGTHLRASYVRKHVTYLDEILRNGNAAPAARIHRDRF